MDIRKDKKALDKLYRRRDRYDLQPDFQREEVWSEQKQQKLMDTILKKWDIPKIYLRVIDEENFEVVDGQQRIATIFRFYDNNLKLPKESGEDSGRTYEDLPDKIKDIFDDYELDLALIYKSTDEELRELFSRLQLGVPLNSAEKLNAMSGKMRDFVKNLSDHTFLKNKVPLSSKRYAYQSIIAQICLLEIDGIKTAKFSDLQDFYNRNKNFDADSIKGKKIINILHEMDTIFPAKTLAFRNRASVISFYLLLSELRDNNIRLDDNIISKLKNFYQDFQIILKKEVEKGASAKDTELIVYQSSVSQAADSRDSIQKRHQILRRRLMDFDSDFVKYLKPDEGDENSVKLKKKDEIKELAKEIITNVSGINKKYRIAHDEDLFIIGDIGEINKIGDMVAGEKEFGDFIDAVYKILYEGSGSLNRIPDLFKEDVLIEIKHLRTDLRHDIEHGDNKKKKREDISRIYQSYTGKVLLSDLNVSDLIKFQKDILVKVVQLLNNMKKQ